MPTRFCAVQCGASATSFASPYMSILPPLRRIRLRGRNTPDRVLSRDVVRELLEEVNPRILRCPWPQCGALCDKRYRDPNAMAGAIDDDDGADHGAANGGAPAAHL